VAVPLAVDEGAVDVEDRGPEGLRTVGGQANLIIGG
jgi:hypothetical protein